VHFIGVALYDRLERQVFVRDVDRENSGWLQVPEVEIEGLPREQMDRNRVARERVDDGKIELLPIPAVRGPIARRRAGSSNQPASRGMKKN